MANENTPAPEVKTPPAPVLGLPPDPPTGDGKPPEVKVDDKVVKPGEKVPEVKPGEKPADPPKVIELKVPDGFKADPKLLETFKATATELKLDGPASQKLFDQYVTIEKGREAAAEAAFTQQDAAWREEISKDAEFGGANYTAAQTAANRALREFGGKELAGLLAKTGLDNNPAVFRTLARIGKRMGEDKIGTNQPPATGPKTLGDVLYPDKKE